MIVPGIHILTMSR